MSFSIKNRPFATEPITGIMLTDGLFAAGIGKQNINAYFQNDASAVNNVQVYLESVSNPNIVVTPHTFALAAAEHNATHLFYWEADLTNAPAGKHYVSFIVQTASGSQRIIKQIFVTRIGFDAATQMFTATTPEGVMSVAFESMIGPKDGCGKCRKDDTADCCCCRPAPEITLNRASTAAVLDNVTFTHVAASQPVGNVLDYLVKGFQGHDPRFEFCLPGYLPGKVRTSITPTPPFAGQYGDIPFQDPWWKVILCIIAVLLLIAAAIAEAVDGSGSITVSGGTGSSDPSDPTCCGVSASGGGTSYVAAGLLAAAAAVATAAAASDARDPYRLGQDHTTPASSTEVTIQEDVLLHFKYSDPIAPGKPFKAAVDWDYTRVTDVATYSHSDTIDGVNIHTISKYEIDAPDVVRAYQRELFVIKARFYDDDGKQLRGDQLFVQAFLIGPAGQYRRILLEDSGVMPDEKANDGTYTGSYRFTPKEKGMWTYFVIAQDINNASPDMEPEEAAQIIGGMILTGQLTVGFEGGTCPLVPDGHVNVIA